MHVLVVEDEPRLASLLRMGLAEEGYAVTVCGDGDEALWQATETELDAIVLDVMLPGRDGLSVCRTLRERSNWTPVILLTARTDVEDRVRGLDAGADDYLTKPFSFAELAARLRALLRRGGVERPTALTAGDLQVDPAAREVLVGDRVVELTAREFAILELFVRRPGLVLRRDQIMDHVWDFASTPGSNVVDQHVANVRRKLMEANCTASIVTVRGVGYRLSTP